MMINSKRFVPGSPSNAFSVSSISEYSSYDCTSNGNSNQSFSFSSHRRISQSIDLQPFTLDYFQPSPLVTESRPLSGFAFLPCRNANTNFHQELSPVLTNAIQDVQTTDSINLSSTEQMPSCHQHYSIQQFVDPIYHNDPQNQHDNNLSSSHIDGSIPSIMNALFPTSCSSSMGYNTQSNDSFVDDSHRIIHTLNNFNDDYYESEDGNLRFYSSSVATPNNSSIVLYPPILGSTTTTRNVSPPEWARPFLNDVDCLTTVQAEEAVSTSSTSTPDVATPTGSLKPPSTLPTTSGPLLSYVSSTDEVMQSSCEQSSIISTFNTERQLYSSASTAATIDPINSSFYSPSNENPPASPEEPPQTQTQLRRESVQSKGLGQLRPTPRSITDRSGLGFLSRRSVVVDSILHGYCLDRPLGLHYDPSISRERHRLHGILAMGKALAPFATMQRKPCNDSKKEVPVNHRDSSKLVDEQNLPDATTNYLGRSCIRAKQNSFPNNLGHSQIRRKNDVQSISDLSHRNFVVNPLKSYKRSPSSVTFQPKREPCKFFCCF